MHVGTTTVENLLRVARRDAAASTAFAAFQAVGSAARIIAVPEPGSAEGLMHDELAELVRQASVDPEFLHARVFVRRVQLRRALTVAVVPLRDGSRDMIGVAADPDRHFETGQLEVLERLAERLVRHVQVVQRMNGRAGEDEPVTRAEDRTNGDSGPEVALDDEPWWTVLADAPSDAPPDAPSYAPSDAGHRGFTAASPVETAAPQRAPGAPAPWDDRVEASRAEHPPTLREPEPQSPAAATEPDTLAAPNEPEDALPDATPPDATPPDATPPAATSPEATPATSPAVSWVRPDHVTGLPSPGQFFSKAGRMLASDGASTGAFVLLVVEVPDEGTAAAAAGVLRSGLRFNDSVARLDRTLLAAALLVSPAESGEVVGRRLAAAVRSAVEKGEHVRTAYVVAELGGRRDADELLREAVSRLPGR